MNKRNFYCVAAVLVITCSITLPSTAQILERDTCRPSSVPDPTVATYDYVIITLDDMLEGLSDFKNWKESLGFSVHSVTTSWIAEAYQGNDLPEKIRNFLIDSYLDWNIKYVLIAGSRDTIPMRTCISFSKYHDDEFLQCPTDYYYADLTGEWDSDGDGYYGEYKQDDMDFYPEVIVGRIPCDTLETLERALNNTIKYESSEGNWKNNVLLLGAVIFYENQDASGYIWERSDGATLMEEVRRDLFEPHSYQCMRMYEEEGIRPTTYDYDKALTRENVLAEWTNGYGIVDMLGHAGNTLITRLVWTEDDGDNIPEYPGELEYPPFLRISDSDDIATLFPPIVYSSGCGQLRTSYNLGRSCIEDGSAVAFVGTTQGSWYDECLKWDDKSDGGTYSLNYYFFENLVDHQQSCGNALYSAKMLYYNRFWYHGYDTNWIFRAYDNMYSLTLYGDPSLGLYERSSDPEQPSQPEGPPQGKRGMSYNYKTSSTDPDGDVVRYLFDWGDRSSTLTEYIPSGETVTCSHTWKSQGDFAVRVRCEDIHGSWSAWSDPLSITIPKGRILVRWLHLSEKLRLLFDIVHENYSVTRLTS